jgi:hypothetical protein
MSQIVTMRSVAAAKATPAFVGTYHTPSGVVNDGHNTSAFDAGGWGLVALVNGPSDGGVAFRDDIENLCNKADINQLFGMVIAHSEGGTFTNTNDTSVWDPLPHDGSGTRGRAGMLQGAARFSALSTYCPQIGGIVIDDFWSNYGPPVPPPVPGHCGECPAERPHIYGSFSAGFYCCEWEAHGHCTPPAGAKKNPSCCVLPGSDSGCQHAARCGSNPKNETPCGATTPLDLEGMRDIKAALQGKAVVDGVVDHASAATTPQLRLFVVTYQMQIHQLQQQQLLTEGIVDGLSFWIGGPSQQAHTSPHAIQASTPSSPCPSPPPAGGARQPDRLRPPDPWPRRPLAACLHGRVSRTRHLPRMVPQRHGRGSSRRRAIATLLPRAGTSPTRHWGGCHPLPSTTCSSSRSRCTTPAQCKASTCSLAPCCRT